MSTTGNPRAHAVLASVLTSAITTCLAVVVATSHSPGQARHWKDLGHGQRGPQLTATSVYIGQYVRFNLSSAPPNSIVFFVLGVGRADLQILGAHMVPRPDLVLRTTTDRYGIAMARIQIPKLPQLDGLDLYLQALVIDSQANAASSPALKGFLFSPGNPFDEIACDFLHSEPEEGTKHKAWRDKLKQELVKALKAEGITKNEITKIVKDGFRGIPGIIKNLWRLYKALSAIRNARRAAGPEPRFID